MRAHVFLVLLAAATMMAAAAQAGNSGKTATPVPAKPGYATSGQPGSAHASGYDPNQVICREQQATIGSRFGGGEICHTRAQWGQMTEDTQQQLSRMQGSTGGGGH